MTTSSRGDGRQVDFYDLLVKDIEELKRRCTALEASQTWAVKVVIGAVLMALMGLVLAKGAVV